MDWIVARAKEPSTWYGVGVVLAGLASHFAPAEWASVLGGVQYVLGGAAVVTPEHK
jgi:hypothetical protein